MRMAESPQECLQTIVSLNQLKREFHDFQNSVISDLNRIAKESMEDIVALWKLATASQKRKPAPKQKPNEELRAAFDILHQKQQLIEDIEGKLRDVEDSKEELLCILRKQTEICNQLRNQQQEQSLKFSSRAHELQSILDEKESVIMELTTESMILKKLLKEEYQSKETYHHFDKEYSTNPRFQEPNDNNSMHSTHSKKLYQNRNSQITLLSESLKKRDPLRPRNRESSFKVLKPFRPASSATSIKGQIQKIIQKAVKENYQKYKR